MALALNDPLWRHILDQGKYIFVYDKDIDYCLQWYIMYTCIFIGCETKTIFGTPTPKYFSQNSHRFAFWVYV